MRSDNPDVSFVLNDFVGGGGAERVVISLANYFVSTGLSVDLVVANTEGTIGDLVDGRVKLVSFDKKSMSRCLVDLMRYFRERRPRRIIASLKAAIVMSTAARFLSGYRAAGFARRGGAAASRGADGEPTLFVRVDNQITHVPRPRGSKVDARRFAVRRMKFLIWRQYVRLAYGRFDGVIALSRGVQEEHKALSPQAHMEMIYNPVPVRPGRSGHERFSWPQGPTILAVGRLDIQKNFALLVDAFRIVRDRFKCKLVILGEGDQRRFLEEQIRDLSLEGEVLLPGHAENAQELMSRCDLFVFSSDYEGLGNVLVEALRAGARIVSTDCPHGPAEVLGYGKYGTLVPVGDAERMAEAMLRGLTTPRAPQPADIEEHLRQFTVEYAGQRYLQFCRLP